MKTETRSVGSLLFRAAILLLVLTMLSVWLVCGLFAKYTTSDAEGNDARVAATGVKVFELKEHKVKEDKTPFELDMSEEVDANTYKDVEAGMKIPKDPFVRIVLKDAEVDYYLYIRVTEGEDFPEGVEYTIDSDWEEVPETENVYKYNGYFDAGNYNLDGEKVIYILENNEILVTKEYDEETEFSLSFEAWLVQVD